jgi:alpha-L-arabinofuranosidase
MTGIERNSDVVLTSAKTSDENSLDQPAKVVPVESIINVAQPTFSYVFPANSLTILRVKTQ